MTSEEVIAAACADGGKYLGRIGLARLLATEPGWTDKRANAAVARVSAVVFGEHPPIETSDLTIAWLTDPRAGGRRLTAWANCVRHVGAVWAGFPYAPLPTQEGAA